MDIVGDRRFVELAGDRTHKLPPLLVKTVPEVTLLEDKEIQTKGVQLEKAVGLRLAFRQMPPMRCCSDQFLFYLNNSVAQTAYRTWLNMTPSPISSLPPERFQFEIVNMSLEVH